MKDPLLNELPRYSPWPGILLNEGLVSPKKKTREEVLREYDREKWLTLLSQVESNQNFDLSEANKQFYSKDSALILVNQKLQLSDNYSAFQQYLDLIERELLVYLPSEGLVELGCGYGGVILDMVVKLRGKVGKFEALELTQSGCRACTLFSASLKERVRVDLCDLTASPIALNVVKNALIFTSFSATYVTSYSRSTIKQLIALKPKIVIHFEPVYEHFTDDSLLGLMQRSYIRFNDYNQNMLTVLHEAQRDGLIHIVKESKLVFGINPLLPCSIIVWRPVEVL